MRQPIIIGTPYPTPEEVAREYGVSRRRLKELQNMVTDFLSREHLGKARPGINDHSSSRRTTDSKRKASEG